MSSDRLANTSPLCSVFFLQKNHGRYFAGRNISAELMEGNQKYRKTGQGVSLAGTGLAGDETLGVEEEEEQRRDKYAEWLQKEGAQ